jgi:transmembrane sensor
VDSHKASSMSEYSDMDNIAAFPNKTKIKEEACNWVVRIDRRDMSEDDVRAMQAWVKRNKLHRDYLFKLAAEWDAMGRLKELAEIFPLPETESQRNQASAVRKARLTLPVATFAVTAAIVVLSFISLQAKWFSSPGQQVYTTAVGEQAEYVLEDGTRVALNTDSILNVEYTGNLRKVTLLRGEGNFEVAKNPEQPFVVYAGNGMIWAVGTAFNVRYIENLVDVTVTEGTVKVFSDIKAEHEKQPAAATTSVDNFEPKPVSNPNRENNEALLNAGQSIRYSQAIESIESVLNEEIDRKLAWQSGSLIFKGETLQQALIEIERYTDKELVIVDPAIGQLRIGGHYKTNNINALLLALGEGLGLKIEHISDKRIQLSAK